MTSLREKAVAGIAWSAVERISQTVVVFVVQLFLARILGPEQFGLLAMVSVFVVISNTIVDSGLGSALVQRKDITDADHSTVFIFNLAAAILMAAVLWMAGPAIASFYRQPVLADVVAVLGLGLILHAIGAVHKAQLQRQLAFKKLFWVTTPATVLSGMIGIGLALKGFGVWALVAQTLCLRAMGALSLWFQTGWRPRAVFEASRFGVLFSFGSKLALSSILQQSFSNIYLLVIGRVFSPIEVGFFQRAKAMRELPIATLQSVVGSVMFPVLSAVQQDSDRMKHILRRSLQLSSLIAFSAMAFVAGLAGPLVLFLVGEKWLPCVPMLQLLCISGALYPLHAGNLSLLEATGRSDLFLKVEIIKKVTTLANIFITYRYGIYAMMWGMVATSVLALMINTYYTDKIIRYDLGQQAKDIAPALGLGALIFVVTSSVSLFTSGAPAVVGVMIGLLLAGGAGIGAVRLMPEEIKTEIRSWSARLPKRLHLAFGKIV